MSNCILEKCNFVHIPKCGGTSILTALHMLGCIRDQDKQVILRPHYGHLFASQMPENGLPFFSFVRHPVSWWESFYHWNMNPEHTRFCEAELQTKSINEWIQDYGQLWLGFYSRMVKRYLGEDPNFPTRNLVKLIGTTENLFPSLKQIFDFVGQYYQPNVMNQLIAGTANFKPEWSNTQNYSRAAVSAEHAKLICKVENEIIREFYPDTPL